MCVVSVCVRVCMCPRVRVCLHIRVCACYVLYVVCIRMYEYYALYVDGVYSVHCEYICVCVYMTV